MIKRYNRDFGKIPKEGTLFPSYRAYKAMEKLREEVRQQELLHPTMYKVSSRPPTPPPPRRRRVEETIE